MNKKLKKSLKEFSVCLKEDRRLSKKEKTQMHGLLVKMYPAFKSLFDKHGYYSTVRPQMNFLIKRDKMLVATGKFLWRNVGIKNKTFKLFALGMVVAKEYQNRGLGTKLVQLSIENARKRKADILYGSTSNLKVKKILTKLGFQRLTAPIFYKDITTKEIKREKEFAYVFEFKKGLFEKLNALPRIYIGKGPI